MSDFSAHQALAATADERDRWAAVLGKKPSQMQAATPAPAAPDLITALINFAAVYRYLDEQSQSKARPVYLAANALLASEMTAAEANAADLRNANDKVGKAHRVHERRALQLQQNDVAAQFGGWAS